MSLPNVNLDLKNSASSSALQFQEFDISDAANLSGLAGGNVGGSGNGLFLNSASAPRPGTSIFDDGGNSGAAHGGGLASKPMFQLENYFKYFNVTTEDVLGRVQAGITCRHTFLEDLCGRPDSYGPFWLATTVAIGTFITVSFGHAFLSSAHNTPAPPAAKIIVDYSQLLQALCFFYTYAAGFPVIIWTVMQWLGINNGIVLKASELFTLTGYSLAPMLPALLICILPFSSLRWMTLLAAAVVSAMFIVRNLRPLFKSSLVPSSAKFQQAYLLLVIWMIMHIIFFVLLRVKFFY